MAKCEISGKRRSFGNKVSHANNRSRRSWAPNVQKIRIVEENGTIRRAKVSTKVIRSNEVMKAPPRRVIMEMLKEEQEKA